MSSSTIYPYFCTHAHGWVFDDPSVGLTAEPFVQGSSEIISAFVGDRIPKAAFGFRLTFSEDYPPATAETVPTLKLEKVRPENGGAWYATILNGESMLGWLCPALYKYFEQPPNVIYAQAFPANDRTRREINRQQFIDKLRRDNTRLQAALDVSNFALHFATLFIDDTLDSPILQSQVKAAHDAYREATGEESFDVQIRERIEARKKREASGD